MTQLDSAAHHGASKGADMKLSSCELLALAVAHLGQSCLKSFATSLSCHVCEFGSAADCDRVSAARALKALCFGNSSLVLLE